MIIAGLLGPLLNSAPLRIFLFIPLIGTAVPGIALSKVTICRISKLPLCVDSKMKHYFHVEGRTSLHIQYIISTLHLYSCFLKIIFCELLCLMG